MSTTYDHPNPKVQKGVDDMLIADKDSYVLTVFQCQSPIAPRKRNG